MSGKGKGGGRHTPFDQSGEVVHALAGASELFRHVQTLARRSRAASGGIGYAGAKVAARNRRSA